VRRESNKTEMPIRFVQRDGALASAVSNNLKPDKLRKINAGCRLLLFYKSQV
jgi:hypothetical protein